MSLEEEIVGTPMEKRKITADTLRQFRDTPGFKVLAEFAKEQQANLMRALIEGDDKEDLIQIRADMKSWYHLLKHVDQNVQQFDDWVEQTLRIKEQQEQMGNNYAR